MKEAFYCFLQGPRMGLFFGSAPDQHGKNGQLKKSQTAHTVI
jgi:hypothetical protein